MAKIKIQDREYSVEFNALAAMLYEQISEHNAFDLEYIQANQMKYSLQVLYAMLLANNDNTPEFNDIVRSFKNQKELNDCMNIVAKEVEAWYKPMLKDIKAPKRNSKKGDDPKNA